jgi:hypothetical protein
LDLIAALNAWASCCFASLTSSSEAIYFTSFICLLLGTTLTTLTLLVDGFCVKAGFFVFLMSSAFELCLSGYLFSI